MIRIGVIGAIGSGKSHVSKIFGYPIFNADLEVSKIYKNNKSIFYKIKKIIPKYIKSFPIDKNEILKSILSNKKNLEKIIKIVHPEIKKKMKSFLVKNQDKEIIILDVPLLLENKINKKNDILVFIDARQADISKKLKKRKNFNSKIFNIFKKIQLPLEFKRKKARFVIKNDFTNYSVKKDVRLILKKILTK